MAARVRVSALNSVDLPTLGRPTMARIGSISAGPGSASRRACRRRRGAKGGQIPVVTKHEQQITGDDRRAADALFAVLGARYEGARGRVEPMYETAEVCDDDAT